jgi:hypothetical protein
VTYISPALRRLVIERAGNCCEYCLLNAADDILPFHIDHIKSEKHGGATNGDNLANACYLCNMHKGSDIASEDPDTGRATFLYNPRKQKWSDHFRLNGAIVEPLTPEGRVTVFLLQLNDPDRVKEREGLIRLNSYPCQFSF